MTVHFTLEIPVKQRVWYVPSILETLKYAWIQYLALLLPALWLYNKFVSFLFRYRFLQANVVGDLAPKKII